MSENAPSVLLVTWRWRLKDPFREKRRASKTEPSSNDKYLPLFLVGWLKKSLRVVPRIVGLTTSKMSQRPIEHHRG